MKLALDAWKYTVSTNCEYVESANPTAAKHSFHYFNKPPSSYNLYPSNQMIVAEGWRSGTMLNYSPATRTVSRGGSTVQGDTIQACHLSQTLAVDSPRLMIGSTHTKTPHAADLLWARPNAGSHWVGVTCENMKARGLLTGGQRRGHWAERPSASVRFFNAKYVVDDATPSEQKPSIVIKTSINSPNVILGWRSERAKSMSHSRPCPSFFGKHGCAYVHMNCVRRIYV